MDPSFLSIRKHATTLDGCIGRVGCEGQWRELIKGQPIVLFVLHKECISQLPTRLGKLGCIPGNRPPIITQASAMVDGIVGGEEHVVGQSEDVLRHSRGCGNDSKASKVKVT